MRIPVFAAGSNPSIDRPIKSFAKEHVAWQVALGAMCWLNKGKSQAAYVGNRRGFVQAPIARPTDKPYFINPASIDNGRHWEPRFSGPVMTLQMVP